MRCRTTFYTSLGRLLLVDLGEDEEKFYQFMMPLTGDLCRPIIVAQLCVCVAELILSASTVSYTHLTLPTSVAV